MMDVFSWVGESELERIAQSNVLLAFDYDGTLAPIVPDRAAAVMRPSTRSLLGEVSTLYRCVVISGRAQDDVRERLCDVGGLDVVGNHGIEPSHASAHFAEQARSWLERLRAPMAEIPGVFIEDKVYSLALHYRAAGDRKAAREAIIGAARELEAVRVIGGKEVVNLVPEGAPNKGTALLQCQHRFQCEASLYIGDDDTDEDVFSLGEHDSLITIRVGLNDKSRAAFFIRAQQEIDRLIELLIALRGPPRVAEQAKRGVSKRDYTVE